MKAVWVSWPSFGDDKIYRVVVKNETTGRRASVYVGPDRSCPVPSEFARGDAFLTFKVEARRVDESDDKFGSVLPQQVVKPLDAADAERPDVLSCPPAEDGAIYRLYVRDVVAEETVLDYCSRTPFVRLAPGVLTPGRSYKYRFFRWTPQESLPLTDYVDIPAAYFLSQADAARPSGAATVEPRLAPAQREIEPGVAAPAKTPVLVLVDVFADPTLALDPDPAKVFETQVNGRGGGRELGLERLLDLVETAGARATVFLDALSVDLFGEAPLRAAAELAERRGHGVELLVRPYPSALYSTDPALAAAGSSLRSAPPMETYALALEAATTRFERLTGRRPAVSRHAPGLLRDEVFPLLAAQGIRAEAGLSPGEALAPAWMRARTRPFLGPAGVAVLPAARFVSRPAHRHDRPRMSVLSPDGGTSEAQKAAGVAAPGPGAPVVLPLAVTDLLFRRSATPDEARRWNALIAACAPAAAAKALERSETPFAYFSGEDEIRGETVAALLKGLGGPDREAMTVARFLDKGLDAALACAPSYEPVWEFDRGVRRARESGVRRYNVDFLAALESETA